MPDPGATYSVVNPANEDVVGTAPESTPADAEAAAGRAHAAVGAWSALPVAERAALLTRASEMLAQRAGDFVDLVQAETGGTTTYVRDVQVGEAVHRLAHYASLAAGLREEHLAPAGVGVAAVEAAVMRRPIGVAACITPYNVPLVALTGKIAPALAMGNTVVIKPAVQCPLSSLALVELMHEVDFPEDVVTIVTGSDPAMSRALVASPLVGMISFTGSTAVGSDIAAVAAPRFARLLLELGGKGAAVVFADADLDATLAGVTSIFTRYSGQVCTAPSRLIVERSRYDEVVERVSSLARMLVVGDPRDPGTSVGPVISAAHRDRVLGMIDRAVAAGLSRTAGGDTPLPDRGFFVAPTVFAGATRDSEIMQEEVFGPVLAVAAFDTEDEAVDLANSTRYGLTNYVWTADLDRGRRVARQLRSGTVAVNTGARHPEAPFGGMGMSGVGREGGLHSLYAYSDLESIIWRSA